MLTRFEDLEAWMLARELTNRIYGISKEGPITRDYGYIDQIRRASLSVMSNIAEGFERGSNKDFAKFIFIARGSAGEVRSMLYIALDQKYIDKKTFNEIHDLCIRSSQICWGLIKHLQKKSDWKTGLLIFAMLMASLFAPNIIKRF